MGLVNSILSWAFKKRIRQVNHFIKTPYQTQQRVLQGLLQQGASTEYGRKYGFSDIKTPNQFQEQVPIVTYEQLFPYIQRTMKGEEQVLWPSPITWFAKSSGTTSGKSKFLPVSRESLDECHFKAGKDILAIHCHNNPDTGLFNGKGLVMGGSHQVNHLNEHSKYGDVSAVMMQNMPFLGRLLKTPELKIALLDDWEEKLELMAQTTLKQNVTNIAGVPTWTLVLIKRLFELTGKDDLSEIWPELELYVHGGVNFEPYREQFTGLISSPKMKYMQAYNASEGFFAIQSKNLASDMLLMLDYGIYYEFIPSDEIDSESPKALQLGEVETGKRYAIVISTNSGLWRYKIGDMIEFTSVNPYKIKVAGRTKSFINAFGEEVIVENADKAIAEACKQCNAVFREYTAGPVYLEFESKGCHEWLIEFEKEPCDINHFAKVLDKTLQSINSDYEAKRSKNIALEMPKVQVMPTNSFNQWLKSKGKLGGQHKVPRLSNNRDILDSLLQLC